MAKAKTTVVLEVQIEGALARYLAWYARNILLVERWEEAALHFLLCQTTRQRLENLDKEPRVF